MTGCGDSGPEVVPVEGTVTLDGKPLANKSLLFTPIDDTAGHGAGGTSDAEGRYTLIAVVPGATRDYQGIAPGRYRVSVFEPMLPGDLPAGEDDLPGAVDQKHRIGRCFRELAHLFAAGLEVCELPRRLPFVTEDDGGDDGDGGDGDGPVAQHHPRRRLLGLGHKETQYREERREHADEERWSSLLATDRYRNGRHMHGAHGDTERRKQIRHEHEAREPKTRRERDPTGGTLGIDGAGSGRCVG